MMKKSKLFHNLFSISVYTTLIALIIMIITVLETGEPDFNWFTVATISTVATCFSGIFYKYFKEQEEK